MTFSQNFKNCIDSNASGQMKCSVYLGILFSFLCSVLCLGGSVFVACVVRLSCTCLKRVFTHFHVSCMYFYLFLFFFSIFNRPREMAGRTPIRLFTYRRRVRGGKHPPKRVNKNPPKPIPMTTQQPPTVVTAPVASCSPPTLVECPVLTGTVNGTTLTNFTVSEYDDYCTRILTFTLSNGPLNFQEGMVDLIQANAEFKGLTLALYLAHIGCKVYCTAIRHSATAPGTFEDCLMRIYNPGVSTSARFIIRCNASTDAANPNALNSHIAYVERVNKCTPVKDQVMTAQFDAFCIKAKVDFERLYDEFDPFSAQPPPDVVIPALVPIPIEPIRAPAVLDLEPTIAEIVVVEVPTVASQLDVTLVTGTPITSNLPTHTVVDMDAAMTLWNIQLPDPTTCFIFLFRLGACFKKTNILFICAREKMETCLRLMRRCLPIIHKAWIMPAMPISVSCLRNMKDMLIRVRTRSPLAWLVLIQLSCFPMDLTVLPFWSCVVINLLLHFAFHPKYILYCLFYVVKFTWFLNLILSYGQADTGKAVHINYPFSFALWYAVAVFAILPMLWNLLYHALGVVLAHSLCFTPAEVCELESRETILYSCSCPASFKRVDRCVHRDWDQNVRKQLVNLPPGFPHGLSSRLVTALKLFLQRLGYQFNEPIVTFFCCGPCHPPPVNYSIRVLSPKDRSIEIRSEQVFYSHPYVHTSVTGFVQPLISAPYTILRDEFGSWQLIGEEVMSYQGQQIPCDVFKRVGCSDFSFNRDTNSAFAAPAGVDVGIYSRMRDHIAARDGITPLSILHSINTNFRDTKQLAMADQARVLEHICKTTCISYNLSVQGGRGYFGKGAATPHLTHPTLTWCCVWCGWFPPPKSHWKHRTCPGCLSYFTREFLLGGSLQHRDGYVKHFRAPIGMKPIESTPKVKDTREVVYVCPKVPPKPSRAQGPYLIGIGHDHWKPTKFAKTLTNELLAITYRIFAQPLNQLIRPDPGGKNGKALWTKYEEDLSLFNLRWKNMSKFMMRTGLLDLTVSPCPLYGYGDLDWLRDNMPELYFKEGQFLADYPLDSWLGMPVDHSAEPWITHFAPNRKRQLWPTMVQYLKYGLPQNIDFKLFQKDELACNDMPPGDIEFPPSNPRCIQAPSDYTHIVMGPWMRNATRALHHKWHMGTLTYASGMNPNQLDKWLSTHVDAGGFRRPEFASHAFFENDYSMFDSTYSTGTMEFVRNIYSTWGLNMHNRDVLRCLQMWEHPRGTTSSGGYYMAPVMNASGRDDTALMNALVNGCVQVTLFSELIAGLSCDHIPGNIIPGLLKQFRIIVLGDDSLTVAPDYICTKDIADKVAFYGLEAKPLVKYDPLTIVFLGQRPYLCNGPYGWAFAKTIGRTIYKHHWKLQYDQDVDAQAWLRGIIVSERQTCGFVPILSELNEKADEHLSSIKITPKGYDEHQDWQSPIAEREETYVATLRQREETLMRVYSIHPGQYRDFRRCLEAVKAVPCLFDHHVIDMVVKADV